MKTLTYLILTLAIGGCAFAQPEITGAKWNLTLNVTDENGQPVPDAQVSIGYRPKRKPGQSVADYRLQPAELKGFTDTNGFFATSHTDTSWNIRIDVEKSGYYFTVIEHQLFMPGQVGESEVEASRNATLTVVLKKIIKPTAMYAKRIRLKVPEFNKAIGYDLMVGDWVGPYGKGINTDLFFTEIHTNAEYILMISFPKLGDGVREFTVPNAEKDSGLRSAYEAPADGYQREMAQTEATNPNRNFYFRIRTKIDDHGNTVSAHYGKIYGDLAQFSYYLNPTINDRNIEFDPKQNLIYGFKSNEEVSAP
jgi:hypothetical protein